MIDGFLQVAEGAYCEVWFSKKTLKVYKKAPSNDRARLTKILGHICENGPNDLNDTQFKAERRFPDNKGKDIMVYAAKSYQLRVYGCWNDGPPRQLICSEAAIKKSNKADNDQLKRAAKSAGV